MKHPRAIQFLLCALILCGGFLATIPIAHAGNIDTVEPNHWAWNDVIGWIDFGYAAGNVEVTDTEITGYASSSVGFIALDCATAPTPPAPTCGGPAGNWGITNDTSGNLSGWAWSDAVGWISFNCANAGTNGCTSPGVNYKVTINTATGDFSGWAWNDVIGWISFCGNSSGGSTWNGSAWVCPGSISYKVKTSWMAGPAPQAWLTSPVFDTCPQGVDCGVALNTLMWQGTLPSGARVQFRIATECKSGNLPCGISDNWKFVGPNNSELEGDYYAPQVPGSPVKIKQINHLNARYFRYKIFLIAGDGGQSPIIDDIIVNWSP